MYKLTSKYDQHSVRLEIEGLPDKSAGQGSEVIGILSSWKLQIIGHPELMGNKLHLEDFMSVIMQYSRFCISGIYPELTSKNNTVQISKLKNDHKLTLRSTREGVKPIDIFLDDADLADLARCLDKMLEDENISVEWSLPTYQPLTRRQKKITAISVNLFTNSAIGFLSIAFVTFIFSLMPIPLEYKNDSTSGENDINVPELIKDEESTSR